MQEPASRLRLAHTLLIAALSFTLFLVIALAVANDVTLYVDKLGLLEMRNPADINRPLGPAWLAETARDFTALGSNGVLVALVLIGATALAIAGQRKHAIFLTAAFIGALVLETAVKHLFSRPRPELFLSAPRVFTSSFPSAHSTMSAAAYGAMGLVIAGSHFSRKFGTLALASAACLISIIGVSRVYLGVHWPTDVVAGWALGIGWTALCWAVANLSRFRRDTVGE